MPSRIGVMGSTNSGKTTYLASLDISLNTRNIGINLIPSDDVSTGWLRNNTGNLSKGQFPPATGAPEPFNFKIQGNLNKNFIHQLAVLVGRPRQINIDVNLEDYQGGTYLNAGSTDPIWPLLAKADGIIFLYDIETESATDLTYNYVQNSFSNIFQQLSKVGKNSENGKLPHFLALCLNKFDSPATLNVVNKARDNANRPLFQIQNGVPDLRSPELFFEWLSHKANTQLDASARAINALTRNFQPQNIKYFTTSSIGFYREQGQVGYIPEEYCNQLQTPTGTLVRGYTNPINVLEPFLWLDGAIRKML